MTVAISEIREDLQRDYGDREGYACIAWKDRKHQNPNHFEQRFFEWPSQLDQAVRFVKRQSERGFCVWKPTALLNGERRRSEDACPSNVLSFEVDQQLSEDAHSLLKDVGATLINSGGRGHVHVKVYLDEDVPWEENARLAESVARGCGVTGNKDSGGKWGPADLLRIVGTRNTKEGAGDVTVRTAGHMITAKALTSLVSKPIIHFDRSRATTSIARETANQDALSPRLRRELNKEYEDGSAGGWKFWKMCADEGVSVAQALAHSYNHAGIASHHPPYSESSLVSQINKAYAQSERERRQQQEFADFWEARPILGHVRDFAEARLVVPWAMLGALLVRVAAVIPPVYVLPPTVGSYASLNIFVGLVARSGGGKGTAAKAAADAIDFGEDIFTCPLGSGEGLNKAFGSRQSGGEEPMWFRDAILVEANEVDTLTAQQQRGGSTVGGELRQAWSGEQLGHMYSDPTKRIIIKPHRYRLSLLVGVQPRRAKALVDDAPGGLFQRFLWLPGNTDSPPVVRPACPQQIVLKERKELTFEDLEDAEQLLLHLDRPYSELKVISVPKCADDATVDARLRELRGEVDPLDAHANLCRLKVAALLMWLDDRREAISEEDWRLAGIVMAVSTHTRNEMLDEIKRAQQEAAVERGRTASITDQAKKDHTTRVRALAEVLESKISNAGGMTHNALKKKLTVRQRSLMDDALELLLSSGKLTEQKTKSNRPGKAYFPA